MPKERTANLGRFSDGRTAKTSTSQRSIKAMTWMGYMSALLVVVPGLIN